MKHRSLSVTVRLIALLAFSFSALAGESGPSPEQAADWQQRLERAAALLAEGKAQQAIADQVLEERNTVCYKKFLVNACLRDARRDNVTASKEARRLENESKAMERAVKKEQRLDKDQRAAAAAPERETELKLREAEISAERAATAEREAATKAEKAKKAEEGSKRQAEDAEKYRKKQEDHDARVAAKMKEAARREAEAGVPPK